MFKQGDYIVLLENTEFDAWKKDFVFKQREDCDWLRPEIDLRGDDTNGNTRICFDPLNYRAAGKSYSWRYAEDYEIEAYDQVNRPVNISQLTNPHIIDKIETALDQLSEKLKQS
jgi:hypothetical protein